MTVRTVLLWVLVLASLPVQARTAVGRHWQATVEALTCAADPSRLTVDLRLRHVGPAGLAEVPAVQLIDATGRLHLPKALAWVSGSKALAAWMGAGGVRQVAVGEEVRIQWRFDVPDDAADLRLEAGDAPELALTAARPGSGICARVLKPQELKADAQARAPLPSRPDPELRIHRLAYPCQPAGGGPLRKIDAQFPPYVPDQLVVLGRGYLPNARRIDLPMGKAPARGYAYSGPDEIGGYEDAARRAIVADFPKARAMLVPADKARLFAFNWGQQTSASGNPLYAIGIYALRACPG